MKIQSIEVSFPVPVELPDGFEEVMERMIGMVCKKYEAENPTRSMWPASFGSKITYMPITKEEEKERGTEFDDSVFHIGVFEREASEKTLKKRGIKIQ